MSTAWTASRAGRDSSKIKGYDHAAHGLAPKRQYWTCMKLTTRTHRYTIHSSGSQVALIAACADVPAVC
jgi:hypothetical protein